MCELCKKRPARGGHRFCRRCIGEILSHPTELPKPTYGGSEYIYPKKKKITQ
jgi:hypothetical protein